jgi:hypothetical protein
MSSVRWSRDLPAAELGAVSEESDRGASERAATARRQLEIIEQVAEWMDRRYLDPILGFALPGAGDALGAALGLLTIVAAFRMRAHPIVIARMLINLSIDAVLGSIPFLGAVLDFFYRAHVRNLNLIKAREGRAARASDWLVVCGAALVFLVALCLPIVLVIATIALLW